MRRVPWLLLAALCACGNPDNVVVGGIPTTGNVPAAIVGKVLSAVSGVATVTDQNKATVQRSVVMLSDHANLCPNLTAHPDYFSTHIEPYTVMVLMTPPGKVGSFFVGSTPDTDAMMLVTAGGTQPDFGFPGVGGGMSLSEFGSGSGSHAQGTFDLIVSDSTGTGYELYGNFKTDFCPALATAFVPRVNFNPSP